MNGYSHGRADGRIGRWVRRTILLVGILSVGGAAWYAATVLERPTPEEVIRAVRITRPERRDLERNVSVRGFVEAEETVTVLPLVSGTIDTVAIDVGDAVTDGQVVARIDPARFELDLAQATASFASAESTYRRTRDLYEANATTVQNYDHTRAQFEAARSQRDLAELQLGYTTVKSPIDGVVLVRHLATGDVAAPDRPIVTVGDVSRLSVRAAVPEERYRDFSGKNDTIRVRVESAGVVYPASIRTVAPFVSAETRTFEVRCDVEGDLSDLRPGMSVTVTFVLETIRDVPTVPVEAVGYGGTLWYLDAGIARSIEIPFLFSTEDYLQIPEDLAHHTFIVQGHHFLSDGQHVDVIGER
ncbi:MAG: efflux RND transporter periplasmic adaptor subunit [Alkalispirochaeta sp.]